MSSCVRVPLSFLGSTQRQFSQRHSHVMAKSYIEENDIQLCFARFSCQFQKASDCISNNLYRETILPRYVFGENL